jgi:hypothetical protein
MQRTALLTACLLCLPYAAGCILPYCAYPKLDYTPPVELGTQAGDVRAFRIDITKPTADMSVFVGPVYERLTELPVTNTDEVAAQLKPSVTYGFVVIGIALNYLTHTSHSVALRVYRPGFELVEIQSWGRAHRVAWNPAPDLDAQEKALDTLLPVCRLEAGSKAVPHRDALLFGATEYERLAPMASSAEQRQRLRDKADRLRDRAKE